MMSDIVVKARKPLKPVPVQKTEQKKPVRHELAKKTSSKIEKPGSGRKAVKIAVWLFASLLIISLFFSLSMFFTSAMVDVKPKIQAITLNNEVLTAAMKTASAQDFPYEVITIDKTTYKTIESTGGKYVELKAGGQLTIYNTYSTAPQNLAINTRLALDDGRIYRLNNAITVPGIKNVNGKNVPASITAEVTADSAGGKYNITASDFKGNFKIVGFKGNAKYDAFYATLNGDMTGGFIGQKNTLTPEKEQELTQSLKNELQTLVMGEFNNSKGSAYISYDNLNHLTYGSLSEENDGTRVKVGMRAVLKAITFNEKKLASYLAAKKITGFNNQPVDVSLSNDFSIKILSTSTVPWLEKNLNVSLNGVATIKWVYDKEKIRTDLVGKSAADLGKIKTKYQESISGLEVHFTPFWQIFFPDNISKIKVREKTI